jgi:hypothetical protein
MRSVIHVPISLGAWRIHLHRLRKNIQSFCQLQGLCATRFKALAVACPISASICGSISRVVVGVGFYNVVPDV